MNRIYNEINAISGGKYKDVRFSMATFAGGNVTVTVACRNGDINMLRSDRRLAEHIEKLCCFNADMRLEFVSGDIDVRALRTAAADFTQKFPFVASIADDIRVTAEPPTVRLKMHESMYALAKDDYVPRLEEFLTNRFIDNVAVTVETVKLTQKAEPPAPHSPKYYEVGGLKPLFGQLSCTSAISAADISGNNDDVAVCGILTMATDFMSKGSGVKRSRPYTKFLLYDGCTTLQCRCFPSGGFSLPDAGVTDMPVCAFGNTELERGRTGEITMTVRALATCEANGLEPVKHAPEPADYKTVRPAAYEEYVQASLFQVADTIPESLSGSFVAFDFETTGLSIMYDMPTELGAVKIVDGVIVETFHTLIDPKRPIPEEVSKKTGITDDMVKGQPLFEEVLPDFYKFTYGCSLIGHNIAFDFPFLVKHGNKHGWAFGGRRTFDTMGMAPKVFPGIDILTLDRVLELLGLVNDNAHRALSDATATAKAFIAMSKKLA